jgi:putative ABC transport system permease protein
MRRSRFFHIVTLRLRSLFRRARVEQDLDDEIREHIERKVEEGLARGLTPEDARAAAVRAFGGVDQKKEECRDTRRVSIIEHAIQDVRFAVRHAARTPAAAVTMILMYALGIGLNIAMFAFIRSFVSGPLPGVAREESLVRVRGIDRSQPGRHIGREFSYPEYREYAGQQSLFASVAAWSSSDVTLDVGTSGQENLQSGAATYVTSNYFQVLGIGPVIGAGLPADARDADASPPMVAVISHVVWERHFASAPDVIGRSMKVNGFPVTIAGVAPRRFAGARTGGSHMRVWLPLSTRPLLQRTTPSLASYDDARFGIVARLQPGVRAEEANPTVQAIATRSSQQTTRGPLGAAASADVVTLLGGNYFPPSGSGPDGAGNGPLGLVLFPVLTLLITCTNVSALLAGLAISRRREIAVRLALGAGRRRIVRQLVTESVLLAIIAGVLGLCLIWVLLRLFDANIPDLQIELDWLAIAFTFGVAVLAGIMFGLSPALHATRIALSDALKDTGGGTAASRLRLQSWLVVAQIAFTQPALLGWGAMLLEMRSDLRKLPTQLFADRIVDVRFNTNPRYGSLDEAREEALGRVQARIAAVPGVTAVVPQENLDDFFQVESHPADAVAGVDTASPLEVRTHGAPAGYFALMGISIARGRDFDAGERTRDGAVVIGSNLARRLWGGADPVGRRLFTSGGGVRGTSTLTVIGVVADENDGATLRRGGEPQVVFVPNVRTTSHFLVRTQGPAETAIPGIRAAAADEAPTVPVISARTFASVEASSRSTIVAIMAGAGGAGALALLLSAVGLYAVVAFAVGQRVREIGIRTALGADSRAVLMLFLRRGLRLGLIGLAIGLVLGIAGVRLIAMSVNDAPPGGLLEVGALVAVVVICVALLASWIPARRAARLDPLNALRVE